MRQGLLALAVLAALMAGCAPVMPAAPAYPVRVIEAECPLRVPDELEEGQSLRCGRLRLPQDRADPGGLQVELPFALVAAESVHPEPDPIVYVVGGPGGSALAEFDEVYGWFRGLRRDRDLILYDQRGTLLADPVLDCSAAATAAALPLEQERAERRVPDALEPLDANDLGIQRCAADLQAQGIDLAHYDTPTHAQDLVDLVQALGYTRFNLYATSYGTRIALEMMRLAPVGLRAVALDSVLPPQINAYEWQTAAASDEVLRHALTLCAADPVCAAVYPELPARFDALVARLDDEPLALDLAWQPDLTGSDLLNLLYRRLDATTLPYLPRLIAEMETGETAMLLGLLDGTLAPRRAPPSTVKPLPGPVDEAAVQAFVMQLNAAYYLHLGGMGAEARAEWLRLAARNPDRARLIRFIQAYLAPADAQRLLVQLEGLGDTDLALVFAELAGLPAHPLVSGANLAVECRDEIPFNDYVAALTAHRKLGVADAAVAEEVSQLRRRWAQCALFPTGTAALTQTLPVSSSVPTLILQGGLDATTPPSWSLLAQRTLPNAIRLEFPTAGHEVIRQGGSDALSCPARLTRDFLAAPTQALDTGCLDASIPWAGGEED